MDQWENSYSRFLLNYFIERINTFKAVGMAASFITTNGWPESKEKDDEFTVTANMANGEQEAWSSHACRSNKQKDKFLHLLIENIVLIYFIWLY